MGYDSDVFTNESSVLSRAHDAHCAVAFLYGEQKREAEKALTLVPNSPEHTMSLGRSQILTIAYRLAQHCRDALLEDLCQTRTLKSASAATPEPTTTSEESAGTSI